MEYYKIYSCDYIPKSFEYKDYLDDVSIIAFDTNSIYDKLIMYAVGMMPYGRKRIDYNTYFETVDDIKYIRFYSDKTKDCFIVIENKNIDRLIELGKTLKPSNYLYVDMMDGLNKTQIYK